MRHSNAHLDKVTKARYHNLLQQKIPGINIPSEAEEMQSPYNADEIYGSCSKYLISKTRDIKKYNLLFKENINYGFRRNLWGMKSWALIVSVAAFAIHGFLSIRLLTVLNALTAKDIGVYSFLALAAMFWIFTVTKY